MEMMREEWHHLLTAIKFTVEGILANQSPNVWNTYGGLERLSKNVQHVLSHHLKVPQGKSYSDVDFWPFVRALRWIDPARWVTMESGRVKGVSVAHAWLRQSLLALNLSAQLVSLVSHNEHLHQYYEDDAFLCQRDYFQAMVICLQALEQNAPALLADINPSLITVQVKKKPGRDRRNLNRSSSLPVHAKSENIMIRRALTEDRLAPPPLMSPKTDTVLSTSTEHAKASDSGSSPEPARDTLLQVLNKTGQVIDLEDEDEFTFSTTSIKPPAQNPNTQPPTLDLYLEVYNQNLYSHFSYPRKPSYADIIPYVAEVEKQDLVKLPQSASVYMESVSEPVSEEQQDQSQSRNILPSDCILSPLTVTVTSTTQMWNSKSFDNRTVNRRMVEGLSDPLRSPTDSFTTDILENEPDSHSISRDSGISSIYPTGETPLATPSSVVFSMPIHSTPLQPSKKYTHQRSQSDHGVKHSPRHPTPQPISKSPDTADLTSSKKPRHIDAEATHSEGFFPHPAKGQSLMSFLSSQDFHTCAELDKENAHFSISEALIAAIEQMKWNQVIRSPGMEEVESDHESDEEIRQLKQRIRIRRRERLKEKARGLPALSDGKTDTSHTTDSGSIHSSSPACSSHDTDSDSSSSEDVHDEEITDGDGGDPNSNLNTLKESGLSLSMASLYSDADIQKSLMHLKKEEDSRKGALSELNYSSYVSAEAVAISLLKKFSENQLPKASDLEWLVSEQDAPQRLLPLPNSYPICPDDGENSDIAYGKRTRLRGNLEWAPPRPQIIFIVHPPPKRKVVLAKQNYRCAGCGAKVEPGFMKRYNYCEYLGKYFCPRCHANQVAYIPGRILRKWDFTKYYVSNFAADLLARIKEDPLFNLQDINSGLYRKVRALDAMRECRLQLGHLRLYIETCRHSKAKLLTAYKRLPSHWLKDIHAYSMEELVAIKQGELLPNTRNLVNDSIAHVSQCQLCKMKGFICELCNNDQDIIFPHELQKVTPCPLCNACYHKSCYIPDKCPKCARLHARQVQLTGTLSDSEEEESTTR